MNRRHGVFTTAMFAVFTLSGWTVAGPVSSSEAERGPRIRVRAQDFRSPLIGRAASLRGDTLLVLHGPERTSIPLDRVTSLEVSRRPRAPILGDGIKGMLIGSTLGALVGLAVSDGNYSTETNIWYGALFGGGAGTVAGLIVGANRRVDDWQPVEPGDLELEAAGRRSSGVRIGATVGF